MRQNNKEIEKYRLRNGRFGSDKFNGNNGAFFVPSPIDGKNLKIICSDQLGWDHVSVSRTNRCPSWKEMSFIKDLFFSEDETVVEFHPKKLIYKNIHPFCLHLWRKQGEEYELPPLIFV